MARLTPKALSIFGATASLSWPSCDNMVVTMRIRTLDGDIGGHPSGESHSVSRNDLPFQMTEIHHPWTGDSF